MSQSKVKAIIVPCKKIQKVLGYFTEENGYQLDRIYPADDPSIIDISKGEKHIRLKRSEKGPFPNLELILNGHFDGLYIETIDLNPPVDVPEANSSFEITKMTDESPWIVGRVGMEYRNLMDHQNERFGASHIRITEGGELSDYVHYHQLRFQMIYCYKGWVKLVYEDQGAPFIMKAGDCVLQAPEIRHRVLECEKGLEVIEVNSPARHMTARDHELKLPTESSDPDRLFGGQRYIHYRGNYNHDDFGFFDATNGVMAVGTLYPKEGIHMKNEYPFLFHFILTGKCELEFEGIQPLSTGDCYVIPKNGEFSLSHCSEDLKILEVREEVDHL
ncbi:MAG: hypothetical protein ISR82_04910 [Candidatus Marinimicrobia bacterium]|nr:hypothetical protein [Candidatus Neomarinimicrobiota bacterium]MBL7010539.1 hypothetical protein [Candidatus Neomarinimicrobiota bacterium]MBL7030459.1 hypothetical protein [Candidatus Neomarinimicrobiota bacterium]